MESNTKTILIVDDNSDVIFVVTTMLERNGYKVKSAQNGLQALEEVFEDIPDLILMDIQMPQLDGYDTTKKLKAEGKFKHIPIIFMSSMDEPINKVKAFKVGAVDYVTKPFNYEELIARISTQIKLHNYQKELEEERFFLNSVVNSLSALFFAFNRKGIPHRWNENFKKVLLQQGKEFKNINILETIDVKDRDRFSEVIKKAFDEGSITADVNIYTEKDLSVPYRLTCLTDTNNKDGLLAVIGVAL